MLISLAWCGIITSESPHSSVVNISQRAAYTLGADRFALVVETTSSQLEIHI